MHTDHDPVDPSVLAELGYEQRDVHAKPMAWAAFWLFAFTIASGIITAVLIRFWNIVPEVPVSQNRFQDRPVKPPLDTPFLQNNSDNTADIAQLRKNEAEILTTPADLHDGFYRIPVDDAIKDIVQRGLPKTAPQQVKRGNFSVGVTVDPSTVSGGYPATGTATPTASAKSPAAPPATTKPAGAKKQ